MPSRPCARKSLDAASTMRSRLAAACCLLAFIVVVASSLPKLDSLNDGHHIIQPRCRPPVLRTRTWRPRNVASTTAAGDVHPRAWIVTLAAAAILMVTMGARQTLGLFISPLNTSTGLGIATISFALAIAQFAWGAIQPVAGAIADRYGARRVLMAGLVVLAIGTALTPWMTSGLGLVFSLGLLAAVGSGAGSFSVLIGAASLHLPAERRGKAAGIINAGGSFGQFVFAPIAQGLIQAVGWMGALWSLAAMTLFALPLARVVAPATPPVPVSYTHLRAHE